MKEEKVIAVDINLTRSVLAWLALALLAAACLGYLAWNRDEAAAAGPQAPPANRLAGPLASSGGMRQYYLSPTNDGAHALTACASGYHMASLWEIVDPSNLKYNTTLGHTLQDSGQGPPTSLPGWVRTGALSSTSSGAGLGNCAIWTSSSVSHYGTIAMLPWDWLNTSGLNPPNFHIWRVNYSECSGSWPTWCVED